MSARDRDGGSGMRDALRARKKKLEEKIEATGFGTENRQRKKRRRDKATAEK